MLKAQWNIYHKASPDDATPARWCNFNIKLSVQLTGSAPTLLYQHKMFMENLHPAWLRLSDFMHESDENELDQFIYLWVIALNTL